ncbi:MAG TPA: WhiB family transcriptional regulator, partial [Acidimicrobiales bacterium]|nr:WhiB family transcriptional regulator [Acidimicrobiales bacterium]
MTLLDPAPPRPVALAEAEAREADIQAETDAWREIAASFLAEVVAPMAGTGWRWARDAACREPAGDPAVTAGRWLGSNQHMRGRSADLLGVCGRCPVRRDCLAAGLTEEHRAHAPITGVRAARPGTRERLLTIGRRLGAESVDDWATVADWYLAGDL